MITADSTRPAMQAAWPFYSLVPVPYSLLLFTSSLIHFFTCSLRFVIQITVSNNSPIFGAQSNETNQLARFFICTRKCLLYTIRCKNQPFAGEAM